MGAAAIIDPAVKQELQKPSDAADITSLELGKKEIARLRGILAQYEMNKFVSVDMPAGNHASDPNTNECVLAVQAYKHKSPYFADPITYFDEASSGMSNLPSGDVYVWGSGRENIGVPKDKENTCPLATKVRGITNAIQVDCGENCTAVVTRNGDLFTWGDERGGRLGHMECNKIARVQGALGDKRVVMVAAGQTHMACLTSEGHMYTWGKGNSGALGDGDCSIHERNSPGIVCLADGEPLGHIILIDCSNENTAAVTHDGKLYVWGSGKHGKTGDNGKKNHPYPLLIHRIPPTKQVSLGSLYTGAVTMEGELYTWGYGKAGNLGHGDRRSRSVPTKVEALQYIPIVSVHCTKNQINPMTEGDLEGKENPHTLIVANNGSLYTCGPCHKGFLGNMKNKGLSQPGCDQLSPYRVGSTCSDAPEEGESHYLANVRVLQGIATKIHSGCVGDDGYVYTFGCGSSGRMGVLKFIEGLHGGRSRMKCYIPVPTKVVKKDKKPLAGVFQISSSARHMAAIVVKEQKPRGESVVESNRTITGGEEKNNPQKDDGGGKLDEG